MLVSYSSNRAVIQQHTFHNTAQIPLPPFRPGQSIRRCNTNAKTHARGAKIHVTNYFKEQAAHPSCDCRRTHHGASRLVHAISAWSVTIQRMPPGHFKILGPTYSHTITAMLGCVLPARLHPVSTMALKGLNISTPRTDGTYTSPHDIKTCVGCTCWAGPAHSNSRDGRRGTALKCFLSCETAPTCEDKKFCCHSGDGKVSTRRTRVLLEGKPR